MRGGESPKTSSLLRAWTRPTLATCSSAKILTNTREWLAKHDVPFDALFFDRDKTSVRTDVFIEDNLENYAALEGAGTFATLVAQPWNVDDPRDLNRVSSVTEFVDMILAQG